MRKVLVVEDEFLIRLTVIDALEEAGFEVIVAATADDALQIIEDHTIHLLFTDIQMPGRLSGVDLAKVVAERFPEAGILVASGRMRPDELAQLGRVSVETIRFFNGDLAAEGDVYETITSLAIRT
ncbi:MULTISPECIES: response regulator transcription factor [Shinella]|uniref:Response regulator n=1 Tax=Shinella sumterensis TaxID=1967501 RepID=A0AA50CNU2_9HYPH|nr:response regulator [Shinella sumterensis]WLR97857.1 response regulator [Shinella sumterensis]